ncbi:MAG: non-canonical purine NTP pyrophosphatase, partial [Opitutaceae bacterium]|nr:non-canonical purine NTP pyrophosphatase [Verrucomicrobiales bacterium]
SARFCCAIALGRILMSSVTGKILAPVSGGAARQVLTFEGFCEGRIASSPSGHGGFGYDPLFIPEGHNKSFAELGENEKNKISHRSRALEKVRATLG